MNGLPSVIPIADKLRSELLELVEKQQEIQREIDRKLGVVIDAVATYRGVSENDLKTKYVIKNINEGFVLISPATQPPPQPEPIVVDTEPMKVPQKVKG